MRSDAKRCNKGARLAVAVVAGLFCAAITGAHAASSVLTKKNPVMARMLWPMNGTAAVQQARREFATSIAEDGDVAVAARQVLPLAQEALARESLSPRAHAFIAMGIADGAQKRSYLDMASKLNRREALLLGLVLRDGIDRRDHAATFASIDRLLLIYPGERERLFPVLAAALRDERALPELARTLDGSSPWHIEFLRQSVQYTESLPNVAKLRMLIDLNDHEFDRGLVAGLAAQGRIKEAFDVYRKAAQRRRAAATWQSDYPPLDWQLADMRGLRAQPEMSGDGLELSVAGGQGGVLARRISPYSDTMTVAIRHSIEPQAQVKDVRLQLFCGEASAPFFEKPFTPQDMRVVVDDIPSGCKYLAVAIYARSWTGAPRVRGVIEAFEIAQK